MIIMIAKRQPDRSNLNSSFKRLTDYIRRVNKPEQVDGVTITNCGYNDDADLAVTEIIATQAKNKRSKADPCYHMVVSFCGNEKPSKDILDDIESELCQAIGLSGHQRISSIHNDADNYHFHVAINKVHPITHNMVEPYYDKYKLIETAEQLEIKHGLEKQIDWQAARDRKEQGQPSNSKQRPDFTKHTSQQSFKEWIAERKEAITTLIDQSQSWDEVFKKLAKFDLTIKKVANGASLATRKGNTTLKLSELGRNYTSGKLEKRFGSLISPSKEIEKIEALEKYKKAPQQKDAESTALWKDFQQRQEHKKIQIAKLKQLKTKEYGRVKTEIATKKAIIKADYLLSGPYKRLAYQRLHENAKAIKAELKQNFGLAQKQIYQQYPERNWQTYLINQAENGSDKALEILRQGKQNQYLVNQLALSGEEKKQAEKIIKSLNPEVNKTGNIIYKFDKSNITDSGDKVTTDHADKATIAAMLRISREKYGDQINVEGDTKFKQLAAEVAVAEGMPITFTDPETERKRQIIQAATSKPDWMEKQNNKSNRKQSDEKTTDRGR